MQVDSRLLPSTDNCQPRAIRTRPPHLAVLKAWRTVVSLQNRAGKEQTMHRSNPSKGCAVPSNRASGLMQLLYVGANFECIPAPLGTSCRTLEGGVAAPVPWPHKTRELPNQRCHTLHAARRRTVGVHIAGGNKRPDLHPNLHTVQRGLPVEGGGLDHQVDLLRLG
jgi:hypothetical protein